MIHYTQLWAELCLYRAYFGVGFDIKTVVDFMKYETVHYTK